MKTSAWRRRALHLVLAATALLAFGAPAHAAYPDRPIKLIVPFPAGGTVDYVARQFATQLGRQLGGTVVVENVPGAGGTIATTRVVKAAPDGYTVLFTTPNHTINPALIPNLPFDTVKDLAPVSLLAQIPELLIAHSGQPYNDFAGLVSYAKANPGKLNYASAGNGTLPHITMELMLLRMGLQITHVPYRGAQPAYADLLGGRVDVFFDLSPTARPHVDTGALKALAVSGGARNPMHAQVPTIKETGVAQLELESWFGFFVPARTPAPELAKLRTELQAIITSRDVMERFEKAGGTPLALVGDAAGAVVRRDVERWTRLIQDIGIKAE